MTRWLLGVAVVLAVQAPAAAFWPTTNVTARDVADKQLPVEITIVEHTDGTVEVLYKVTPTGPFRTLTGLHAGASDRNQLLFHFPLSGEGSVVRGLPDQPADLSRPLSGRFRVAKSLLEKSWLALSCPIEPLNLSGQTYRIELASFRKR